MEFNWYVSLGGMDEFQNIPCRILQLVPCGSWWEHMQTRDLSHDYITILLRLGKKEVSKLLIISNCIGISGNNPVFWYWLGKWAVGIYTYNEFQILSQTWASTCKYINSVHTQPSTYTTKMADNILGRNWVCFKDISLQINNKQNLANWKLSELCLSTVIRTIFHDASQETFKNHKLELFYEMEPRGDVTADKWST